MKTALLRVFALALITAPAVCPGQSPATIVQFDPTTQDFINGQTSNITNVLNQQLDELKRHSQSLNDMLTRIGDASKVTPPSADAVNESISQSGSTMQLTNAALASKTAAITGQEVFTETVDGTFTAIGDKIKDKDGKVIGDRDASRYKTEAVMLSSIQEYYRIRDAAIARQKDLQTALLETKIQLDEAADDATIQKLTAQIEVINGQLADCRQQIVNANNDLAVREKEIANQSRVEDKASSEHLTQKGLKDRIKQLFDKTPTLGNANGGAGLKWGKTDTSSSSGSSTPTPP